MGESITTGVISKWNIKTGDYVEADHVVAIIETDKVSVDVRSPNAGTIIETFAQEGDEVSVGNNLFVLGTGGAPPAKAAAPAAPKVAATPAAPKTSTPAAPKVATPATPPKAAATTTTTTTTSPKIAGEVNRSETRVKMTRMRQRIAQRLKEAQNTAAMLTTFQEVDMTNLIAMRNKHKKHLKKYMELKWDL
jgi:2-oxoglutarate dehydrogenase E2 component (dihydrolipoamide succinyltransferase)